MPMRHVVLHYHLFKNAGVTVHTLLQENFGASACARLDGDTPWGVLAPSRLLAYVQARPGLRVLSSHQAQLPAPTSADIVFHPLVFLRHPIDRVGSVYSFERRQPAGSPSLGASVAANNDLAGYVRWRLQAGNGSVIRNFQTVHLSSNFDDMRDALATGQDLEKALAHIRQLPFYGLVERLPESLEWMQASLSPHFGMLDTAHAVHHASEDRSGNLEQRLARIEDALGPQLHAQLLDCNRLDLALYDEAVRRFGQARPE